MKKYFYIIIVLNLIYLGSFAQSSTENSTKSFSNGLGAADYSFNVGTQVGTAFNDSYYFSNYFSPNAKFDLTKKFSLVVGVGVNYTQLNNFPIYTNELNKKNINATQTSIYTYASGIYKLNSKVNINATIMYEDAMFTSQDSPMEMNKQYKDFSVGVNYNVTRNFTINAQMQFSDRPYNNYSNNNSNFRVNSPFGYSPFF